MISSRNLHTQQVLVSEEQWRTENAEVTGIPLSSSCCPCICGRAKLSRIATDLISSPFITRRYHYLTSLNNTSSACHGLDTPFVAARHQGRSLFVLHAPPARVVIPRRLPISLTKCTSRSSRCRSARERRKATVHRRRCSCFVRWGGPLNATAVYDCGRLNPDDERMKDGG